MTQRKNSHRRFEKKWKRTQLMFFVLLFFCSAFISVMLKLFINSEGYDDKCFWLVCSALLWLPLNGLCCVYLEIFVICIPLNPPAFCQLLCEAAFCSGDIKGKNIKKEGNRSLRCRGIPTLLFLFGLVWGVRPTDCGLKMAECAVLFSVEFL